MSSGRLVLTRRAGEVILIGDNIKVTFLDIRGNGTKVMIEAPREINIVREELVGRPKTQPSPEIQPSKE